jgi:hypothetical protein
MTEHTPTPWDIIAGDDYYITAEGYPKEFIGHFKGDDNGGYLAVVGNRPKDFGEANAAFICKAVNNHAALVQALQALVDQVNDYERVNNLAPNPGRTECWDTVAHAKRVLDAVGGSSQS